MGGQIKFDYISYCPRCGYTGKSSKEDVCFFCHINRIPTDWRIADNDHATAGQIEARRDKLMTEVISKRPEFDYSAMKACLEAVKRRAEEEFGKPRDEIRCPRCGYDRFQMVPRRWSLGAGFLTNKVDRVCERCKARF